MVRSEAYHHVDEFCVNNSRKTSCDDDDGDSVIIRSEWASNNEESGHIQRRSLASGEHKIKSQVCELLLLHGNSNSGNGPNDSALSSSSSGVLSSTSNEGISNSMLLSPPGNGSTGVCSVDDKRLRRQIANCNERRRMQSINAGFQALRQLLPCKEGEKMSKAAILQQTAEFIHTLQEEKDRLAEENEIIAQAKRRRIDNSSIMEEQMDTSEDRKTCLIERPNVQSEPALDVLDCLKTIDELKKELMREQQLRKVFEKELVEVKNKTTTSPIFANNTDTKDFPSGNGSTNGKGVEAYRQIFIGTQAQSKLPPSHNSMMSAFTAISSLQDVLNVSPLMPSSTNNSVINSTPEIITNSLHSGLTNSLHSGLNAGYQQPQLVIHTASPATRNTATSLPSTIIVNDAAQTEEKINNTLSTITLTLPSDVVSQLSQTSGNSRQPSHIVLDMANSTASRFVTLNTNHSNQDSAMIIESSNNVKLPSTIVNTPSNLLGNIHQDVTQQFRNYANNNLLVQVNQCQSGLLSNSHSQNFPTYCGTPSPSAQTNSSISCTKSASTVINNGGNHGQISGLHNANNIIGNNGTSESSASLSQRNLQAILDAIRHIEGGSIASSAAVMNNSTSSSPCSQANDLLVR